MINETLNSLYRDYYGNVFCNIIPCGVVDEEVYGNIKPRIVFVLREPHSDHAGFSIPEGLKEQVENGLNNLPFEIGWMPTWRQAGAWAYAIIYGFDKYEVLKRNIIVSKGLQAIGMTNLKKTGGGASANRSQISYYAKKEKDLWLKELEIMNPHLIICGNTYHDVVNNLAIGKNLLATQSDLPYYYSILDTGANQSIVLDFWHPNNRNNRNRNLSILKILIDKLRAKNLLV